MHGMKNVKLGYTQQASPVYHFKNIKENFYTSIMLLDCITETFQVIEDANVSLEGCILANPPIG
jgi:hypothetical protein